MCTHTIIFFVAVTEIKNKLLRKFYIYNEHKFKRDLSSQQERVDQAQ